MRPKSRAVAEQKWSNVLFGVVRVFSGPALRGVPPPDGPGSSTNPGWHRHHGSRKETRFLSVKSIVRTQYLLRPLLSARQSRRRPGREQGAQLPQRGAGMSLSHGRAPRRDLRCGPHYYAVSDALGPDSFRNRGFRHGDLLTSVIIKGAGEAIDQWPSSWTWGSVTRGYGPGAPVQAEPASKGARATQSDASARLPFGRTGPRYRSNQLTVS
jgi:hypothetical protein